MSILEWLRLNPSIFVSLVGMLTALSSLAISWSSYRRDQGRLDVNIGVWNVFNVQTAKHTGESYIRISMVNSGRRSIILDSIGGFPRFWRSRRLLNSWFPKWFPIVGFFLTDPIVLKQISDPSGEYRTLTEAKKLYVSIPIKRDNKPGSSRGWDNMAAFYVADSTGKLHFVSASVLNKFKSDIKASIANL